MSLILDALRKSEAERRRGQAPDLLSEVAPAAARARTVADNRSTTIALVAAAALALLLLAWWLRPAATPVTSVTRHSTNDAAEAAPAGTPRMVASASAPAPASRPEPPPLSPPPASTSPPRAPVNAAVAPDAAPSRAIADPEPVPGSPSARASAPPPVPVPALPAEPATPPPPAFASPDVPLRLGDLSSDERGQLPALKVSMHMWAPDTSLRFAIIDGARVNEGDRVGDALVESILQDAVMLSWRGRRIRLPIR